KLFDYVGAPDAEYVIIAMGSGCETIHQTVEFLAKKGEKVAMVKIRLYRPFSVKDFVAALPASVKKIAVLDRTKEPGAIGEPLYLDVRTAIGEALETKPASFTGWPEIIGGRYGLSSKEFTPAMVKAVFDNLKLASPKNHFTIGIMDDVTNTSLDYDHSWAVEGDEVARCMFYGLGADGTVGANKNSIKIIGSLTDNYAQGYFVYDSKKAGAITVSHLRFGKDPIRSPYLITDANFVACHNFTFLEKYDMLANAHPGATFLLNSPFSADEVWDKIPAEVQKQIIDKKLKFYVIDGIKIAEDLGLGARINVIMQTAFFRISKVIPEEIAIKAIKDAIKKTYGSKGQAIVDMNIKAVDAALENIHEIKIPATVTSKIHRASPVPADAPEFIQEVTAMIISQRGDEIPVSKMPVDGTFPTATTQYEKRNIAVKIPCWEPDLCLQCAMCSFVCPHAAIRVKAYDPKYAQGAPATFKSIAAKGKEFEGLKFTVQVAPEDCTGCGMCVNMCPGKSKTEEGKKAINMVDQIPLREPEAENFKYFLGIPETDPKRYNPATVKGSQLKRPLFEFSGACAGCGETPYVKLLTQLFGDHLLVGNATGCSSIYGGNLPTTPYCQRADGCGPAWSNSLFEDNAEFAFGMRLTTDKLNGYATELLNRVLSSGDAAFAPVTDLLGQIKDA
ncbi:MAG TPA: pyruvate:ferredoxin (flavodoxin) oxidoreductase, partial [Candidatus Sumerlaeota bacterium]|nr:pyruvate:ferredoxin (flavodoxin) oxidoreductase [Candidatus Sumerlaeota bacterium]